MYSHHIVEMAQALENAGLVQEEDRTRVVCALQSCWKNKIASVWGAEDVRHLDHTLTDDQAQEILTLALEELDSNIGITWDVLETRLSEWRNR